MYDSLVIANFFIKKGIDTGIAVTPMKLIKLIYLSHGWHLGYHKKSLISDAVEAWKYGPVIPKIYSEVRQYKAGHIGSMIDINNDWMITSIDLPNQNDFLDAIWSHYKDFTGLQLSTITHEEGSPWSVIRRKNIGIDNPIIPNDLIKEYYINKVAQ